MAKKKGQPKTGGRSKGTPNVVTKVSQEALAVALSGCADTIAKALKKLEHEPYLYIQAVSKLLVYVVPKKTDITTDGERVTHDLSKLTFEQLYELRHGRKPD